MFWDKVSIVYDFVMKMKNSKVNRKLCELVTTIIDENDFVLECACGTGMISIYIAKKCKKLLATDFSDGMLKQTKKKCKNLTNVIIEKSNILKLEYEDESFDKVVAGNVIHLLDNPENALSELLRVCKTGGKVIIPTYINKEKTGKNSFFVKIVAKVGADFKKQFTYKSYKEFIKGYVEDVEFKLVDGAMPCAIAIINK